MIFRAKNGNLVNIVRSKFTTDTDYYLEILKTCHNANISSYTTTYNSIEKNIENIENIINTSKN